MEKFIYWLSGGMGVGYLGPNTHHVISTKIVQEREAIELKKLEDKEQPARAPTGFASACTGGNENGGCSCSWTGANKEHCGNDDGTPCFAHCCVFEADDQ